ncbi:MAG TPA: sigma-70 family RNA polymerase sigma factor [Ktedonobacterales bacterium]|nr:sigma-70 family RNA polymerase sigma factor [Ktedonobacterales bacterium]
MEDDLIRRAQGGDQAAFRALVEQYTPVAWRTARALLADRSAAEDALQDAWLDIWRATPRLDPARPFRPWLLTVVANRCRMQARRRSLPLAPLDDALAERLADETSESGYVGYVGYGAAPTSTADDASLNAALAALTTEQRRVLALRYHADLDLNEIAEVLAIPLGTVKSRLHRALAALRARLGVAPYHIETTETTEIKR